MLCREDSAEDKALHPVLDDIHILQDSTFKGVEVGLAQDYHGTGKYSQTIEYFKFCILWVLQGTVLEQSDERLLKREAFYKLLSSCFFLRSALGT